jgi:hypothetical protein
VLLWARLAGASQADRVASRSVAADVGSSRKDRGLNYLNQILAEQFDFPSVVTLREYGFGSQQNANGSDSSSTH